MPESNVELLRRWNEAFNARDIEALLVYCHPSIEYHSTFAAADGAVYHGHDGMRSWHRDLVEAWGDEIRSEIEAYFDLGQHTVQFFVFHGRGRRSGAEVAMPGAQVARWPHGPRERVRRQRGGAARPGRLRGRAGADRAVTRDDPDKPAANLDLVRSIYAAQDRGDGWEWAHQELEFVSADGPSPGSGTGLADKAERWRDFLDAWEDYRWVVDEYRELDHERVLVIFHRSGRGKTSGLDLGQMPAQGAHLSHVCGGNVTKLAIYSDRDRALADLGLAPEGGSP